MKTVSVALALCLNIGIDPPDVVKTSPCARMECWMGMYFITSVQTPLSFEQLMYKTLHKLQFFEAANTCATATYILSSTDLYFVLVYKQKFLLYAA